VSRAGHWIGFLLGQARASESGAVSRGESRGFEIFPVTADKGIRAWGPDLREVFRQAALGLWSLMVEPGTVRRRRSLAVEVEAGDREALLVAWLNELLFRYETEEFMAADCLIRTLTDSRLVAEVWGEPVDRSRHPLTGHVKAVTYHLLSVAPAADGWEGQVVVDV
jgi:SHS2 domain-containing protein